MSDPHVLRPDHAPTPFTADEIRSAARSGYTVETVTEINGEVVGRQRIEFTDGGPDGAVMVATPIDETGRAVSDARESTAAWTELQAHASFPAAVTEITDEAIDTPLGNVACRRYDVSGPDHTNTFWFSPAHPGMPIRFTSDAINGPTTTVVSITPAH